MQVIYTAASYLHGLAVPIAQVDVASSEAERPVLRNACAGIGPVHLCLGRNRVFGAERRPRVVAQLERRQTRVEDRSREGWLRNGEVGSLLPQGIWTSTSYRLTSFDLIVFGFSVSPPGAWILALPCDAALRNITSFLYSASNFSSSLPSARLRIRKEAGVSAMACVPRP